jgi:hypothetical protein
MSLPQLPGNVEVLTDPRDAETISRQKTRIRELEDEVEQLEKKIRNDKAAIHNLRQRLAPLYHALKQTFGDMEVVVGDDPMSAPEQSSAPNSKWEAIKQRHGGRIAEVIDLLLIHGPMNQSQLAANLKTSGGNVSGNILPKLISMGLVVRRDGKVHLRE